MPRPTPAKAPPAQEWISISEAHDALAVRYCEHVTPDWLVAYNAALQAIRPMLIEGRLPSRPKPGTAFALTVHSADGHVTQRIELDKGRIPGLFWTFFAEAQEASPGRLVTLPTENRASSAHDRFEFHCSGLIEGQSMDGLAESVEVLRSAIPAGTGIELRHVNKGGRPRYDDSRHIAQALAIIDLDGVPARVAIARVAPRMQPGTIMTSLKALKGRLRPQLQRALKARKPAL